VITASWRQVVWIGWLCATTALAIPWFRYHTGIFYTIDPGLYWLLQAALPLGLIAAVAYSRLRSRGFWRYEPAALLSVPVLFGAIYDPLAMLVTVGTLAGALALGGAALRRMGLEPEIALAGLAGFGVLSCVLFLLGLIEGYRVWIFVLLLAAALLGFRRDLMEQGARIRRTLQAWGQAEDVRAAHLGGLMFAAFVLVVLACLVWLTPAWNGDSIRFHLPLIRSYLGSHSLDVPETIPYGYNPQGFEVLAVLPYALGGLGAAQALGPLFFLFALLIAYQLGRSCGIERPWAVIGTILGASIPFLHWSGVVFKNDLALAAYELGALLCYLRWRERRNFRWIVAGTFFMAMSFGVKHVAIFAALPLSLLFGNAVLRQKRRVVSAFAVLLVFACFGLFWHARTYATKHSLVYPYDASAAVRLPHPEMNPLERALRYVKIPYWVHSSGKRLFESPSTQPAGIVLLLLAPLPFLRWRDRRYRGSVAVLWFFVLAYYLYWGGVLSVLRYAIAPALLFAVLAAGGLAYKPRWSVSLCSTAALVFAIPVLVVMELAPAQIPFFVKRTDGGGFLRATLPPYGAVAFLNNHARPQDRIASVGNWAAAYAPNPDLFDHVYRTERRYTPADVVHILAKAPARYLILPNSSNLGELEAAAGASFALNRMYTDGDFVVYGVTARIPVARRHP
jgi:hypothetical protein